MNIQTYTDDGHRQYDLSHVNDQISVSELIEILYQNKVLTVKDVNALLPLGFEMVVENK